MLDLFLRIVEFSWIEIQYLQLEPMKREPIPMKVWYFKRNLQRNKVHLIGYIILNESLQSEINQKLSSVHKITYVTAITDQKMLCHVTCVIMTYCVRKTICNSSLSPLVDKPTRAQTHSCISPLKKLDKPRVYLPRFTVWTWRDKNTRNNYGRNFFYKT